jgi:hypothetical protein
MKATHPLRRLAVVALFPMLAGDTLAGESADAAPLFLYSFNEPGNKIRNEGTIQPADLLTYGADGQPVELFAKSGGGVTGAGADYALDFVSTPNAPGPWAETEEDLVQLPALDAFTITFWAKVVRWAAGASVIRFAGADRRTLHVLLNTGFGLHVSVGNQGMTLVAPENSYEGAENAWTFFSVVWNGQEGTAAIYRGVRNPNVELTLVAQESFPAGRLEPMAGRLFVGNTNAAQKDRPLVGFLDDLRFYPRALSTQEIEEIRLGVGP